MNQLTMGRRLGAGKEAEVFERGAMVVKLYKSAAPKRSAFREAANLALAESFGLSVPPVQGVERIGDRWGVVMARVDGLAFAEALRRQPNQISTYLTAMAQLQLRVHGQSGSQLSSLKARLAGNIPLAKILAEPLRRRLLAGLADLPDGNRLCHGDFHPLNILGPPGQETLLDWLDASSGDPAADVCRSYVLIKHWAPDMASAYVDVYAGLSGESRTRILGWLPFVAAARLAEGVPAEVESLIEMANLC